MPTPAQMSLPITKHLNRGLFSDYYLDHVVPTLPEYQSDELHAQAKMVRDELRALFETLQPEKLDEAQLEERWIKPVLARLGHHWSVQVKIRYRDRGHRKPDYVFTATGDDANALTNQIYEPAQIAHTLALGDAKRWGTNLDLTTGREGNPSQQIDEYLRYSELPWGLLTDGRFWRLYGRDTSKDNSYYAVDLPALLLADSADDFLKYFYLFFRREAFSQAEEGWLNRVLQGSVDYAESLSERLEQEVYDALELIAQGFLRFRRNRLTPDAATLKIIYEQSLVLLYRLLFVFYAESRDIFLLDSQEHYGGVSSLTHIKKLAAERRDFHASDLEREVDFSRFYGMLNDLFFIVDMGSPDLGVPPYNGRLFSTESHPFLADKTVGDAYIVHALDKLARVDTGIKREGRFRRVFVDYRDLDVRHLGAIYEKLLEYQLDIAAAPLTLKDGKYALAQAGETIIKQAGEVYLRTGSHERKITGSYYTPDYIVRFIVEHTLEPLLNDLTHQYATLDTEGRWQVRDPEALRQAILDINVLDPATGSGHFMVEAVAYIAEWLRRLGLPAAVEDEDELVYWKRQVVSACIYGVDVNPLAVELARLSLWLTTIARGRPLSFLDHHVRLGNTLVGTRITAVTPTLPTGQAAANGDQPTLPGEFAFTSAVSAAVGRMGTIEHVIAAHVEDVKRQEHDYASLDAALEPWRKLAHVWTARHFGLNLTPEQWRAVYDFLVNGSTSAQPTAAPIITEAEALHADYRFFHWDLAFPEVFFNADGTTRPDAGFDSVIGNPPYVRQERIQPYKPYLKAHYAVYSGTADIYVYFYERAAALLRPGGYAAYITANKWLRAGYGKPMRAFLAENLETRQLVDFGHAPIFHDADTFPMIVVLQKPAGERAPEANAEITQFPRTSLGKYTLSEYSRQHGYRIPLARFSRSAWSLEPPEAEALMDKIRRAGVPLLKFIGAEPYYGVKTGLNEAFLIDTPTKERLVAADPRSAAIIKPYLRGQDIKRWSPEWAGLWMIVLKSSENQTWDWSNSDEEAENVFAQTFPSIYSYFKPLEDRLRKREDQGRYWWELRSCAYYDALEGEKILYQEIQFHPAYSIDDANYFVNNKCFLLPTSEPFLVTVLNSPLIWWFNWRYLPHMKDEALSPTGVSMLSLPIAQPSDDLRAEVEPAVSRLITLTQQRRQHTADLLNWLKVEFAVEKPGNKLEDFAVLDKNAFVQEVQHRRPRSAGRFSPAALRDLENTYADVSATVRTLNNEMNGLEQFLSACVNRAYDLKSEEIDLMWRTAPPRMPINRD